MRDVGNSERCRNGMQANALAWSVRRLFSGASCGEIAPRLDGVNLPLQQAMGPIRGWAVVRRFLGCGLAH